MVNNYSELTYIYTLANSNSPEIVRYIGISNNPQDRFASHLRESKRLQKTHKQKWIRSVLNNNEKITLDIIRCVENKNKYQEEINTILFFKSLGADLVNGNNGGIGSSMVTPEIREKIRLSKLGNSWNIGRKHSEEFSKGISKRLKGVKKSKEHVEKLVTSRKLNGIKVKQKNRLKSEQLIEIFRLFNVENLTVPEISLKTNITKAAISTCLYTKHQYDDIKEKYNLKVDINRKRRSRPKLNLLKKIKVKSEEQLKKDLDLKNKRLNLLKEVFRLKDLGFNSIYIGKELNLDPRTIRRYLKGDSMKELIEEINKNKNER